jgi:hypothetical protein
MWYRCSCPLLRVITTSFAEAAGPRISVGLVPVPVGGSSSAAGEPFAGQASGGDCRVRQVLGRQRPLTQRELGTNLTEVKRGEIVIIKI